VSVLHDDPILLVFLVAAAGYLAGRLRIGGAGGFGFGIAAVLFVGIGFGAADPTLKVPQPLWQLGLVLFVYTVGLATGPGFLTALRRRGLARTLPVLPPSSPVGRRRSGLAARPRRHRHRRHLRGGSRTRRRSPTRRRCALSEPSASTPCRQVLVGFSVAHPVGVTVALRPYALAAGRRPAPAASTSLAVRTALVDTRVSSWRHPHRLGAAVTFDG
jgi:putative transport protein